MDTSVSPRRPPEKPERQQLSERVVTYLREAIMAGQLEPDSYIRTEHLAADLQISATPVREALMILHSDGVVRWEPRRGFRVVPLTRKDVEDVFVLQAMIAGELASRAAEVIEDEDVRQLDALQQDLASSVNRGQFDEVDRLNHQIHRHINKLSNSHRLASALRSIVNYVPLKFFDLIPGWAEASAHDHAPILQALRDRDPDAARGAMAAHVLHIGSLLVEHLDQNGVLRNPPTGG